MHRLVSLELDGSLTAIERAELERRALRDPETRRERATWARVIGLIASAGHPRRLHIEALAARIIRGVEQRALPLVRLRQAVLAASLAAAGFAALAVEPAPARPDAPKVAALTSSPVEVSLDEREDGADQPVVIRF
jgi:anti-sigma factor RsiW